MRLILFTLFLYNFCLAQNLNSQQAAEYYNDIVIYQNKVVKTSMEYIIRTVHGNGTYDTDSKDVITQIDHAIQTVKIMSDYKKGSKLKNETVDVLTLYREVFSKDMAEVGLLKKDKDNSFEAMERYLDAVEKVEERLHKANERLKVARDAFAKEHNLVIEKNNQLQKKADQINAVNRYRKEVFLIYFKLFKLNSIFMEAFTERNTSQIEKTRTELLIESKKALKVLKTMDGFEKDNAYKNAAIELVNHFKTLSSREYASLELILKKDPKALTQKDVDDYNKLIKDCNASSQQEVNKFITAEKQFLQKYIPASL